MAVTEILKDPAVTLVVDIVIISLSFAFEVLQQGMMEIPGTVHLVDTIQEKLGMTASHSRPHTLPVVCRIR